jgi:hypothetical protein
MSVDNSEDRPGHRPSARPLDELSSSQIGKRLKSLYDEVAREPVPDKFMSLLENLERAEKGRTNGS